MMSLQLIELAANIYLIVGKNNGRFPYSHSILIFSGSDERILVDTGCGLDILQSLKETYSITKIINSHTHPDHSAVNWLFEHNITSIDVPIEGFDTAGNIISLSERFSKPGDLAKYWRMFVGGEIMNFKNWKPTHSYDEKTSFHLGDVVLIPIHTPGHTKDHYCLYEPNEKILFSFDYDLTTFGPWYGHTESNISDFKASIRKLQTLDIQMLVSSHQGIITDQIARQLEKYYQIFNKRDEKIIQLVKNGVKSIDKLVDHAPIYGGFPYAEPLLRFWEEQMIKKHINDLIERGKIKDISENL